MFAVTERVSIARSPEDAFAFFADGRNRPRWDAAVISERLTSAGPVAVGSTIHTRMRAMGREVDYDWRITEFDPPTRMAIRSTAGILPMSSLLVFDAIPDGCSVTATIEGAAHGMLGLVEPIIAGEVRSTLTAGLARAKFILEVPPTLG
ncbi:SRPBCC family protein [Micromonospora sp. DT81.3]